MSQRLTTFFASRWGIILAGSVIGILAPLLQKLGNPPNMGICVACFERDIAGALGLHRAGVVQYIRPEIIGFVFGSLIAAYAFREFKARVGSAPIVRFILGVFAMIGALAFLGCPWRAILRLAGGDLNSLVGLAGLAVGVTGGVLFLKSGFSLGRSYKTYKTAGWILPIIMLGFFLLLVFRVQFSGGAIFFSEAGPGSMYAPILISLGAALIIGFLAQRTRFCTMGSIRDVILMRDTHLISGVGALLVVAFIFNVILGQVNFGIAAQPISHSNFLWNFLGMALAGLAFALAGGCPGRQLFLSGEGDGDAAVFVIGMIVGAALAHNFATASSPKGPGLWGPAFVIIGLVICIIIGFSMRKKI